MMKEAKELIAKDANIVFTPLENDSLMIEIFKKCSMTVELDSNGVQELRLFLNAIGGEGMSSVVIDGVTFKILPEVAGLLQAVSEERDELKAEVKRLRQVDHKTHEDWCSYPKGPCNCGRRYSV